MKRQIIATLVMVLAAGSINNNVSAQSPTPTTAAADADALARVEKFKANRKHIAALEQENARLSANNEVYKEALGTEPVVASSPTVSTTPSPSDSTTDTKGEVAPNPAVTAVSEAKRREIEAKKNLPGPTSTPGTLGEAHPEEVALSDGKTTSTDANQRKIRIVSTGSASLTKIKGPFNLQRKYVNIRSGPEDKVGEWQTVTMVVDAKGTPYRQPTRPVLVKRLKAYEDQLTSFGSTNRGQYRDNYWKVQ